jgi:dephospho-CoA kinase
MDYKNAIVLTGSIATGKSTVSKILDQHGYEIIDADKVTKKMLEIHVDKIAEIFGDEYIFEGKVNGSKLGALIFSDKNEKLKLENFLHPLIKDEIEKQAKILEEKNRPYILDIPLFFETKNYDIDRVVIVYCTKEQQLQRLMDRNSLTKEEAQKRINSQIDIDKKKSLATYMIDNTKDKNTLKSEANSFINKFLI